jgi:hypothetical protein
MCRPVSIFENPYLSGVIGSFIASFLTIGVLEFYKYYKRKIQHSKFRKIFGSYSSDKLNLVLPTLRVRQDIIDRLKILNFPDSDFPLIRLGGAHIRTSKLLAFSDTTSLKYLLDIISGTLGDKSLVTTDEDLSNHLDLSFISFGGTSFYCSYILNEPENKYYNFDGNDIVSKSDMSKRFTNGNGFDYGFIIKYKHANFPKRIWIVIAGLGDTGTSGAGWYLARHWEELSDLFQENAFGIVIKVKNGVDESAIKVDQII